MPPRYWMATWWMRLSEMTLPELISRLSARAADGSGSSVLPSWIPEAAMSVNSLPETMSPWLPYITSRPAPPRWAKVSPSMVTWWVAESTTLAGVRVHDAYGQLPAGVEYVHVPWVLAALGPVRVQSACISAKPSVESGAVQV